MEDRSPRPLLELSEGDDHNLSLLDGIRTIAVASNLWISAGSIHVAVAATEDEPPRVYNTHVIVDATGAVRAEYRKIHLFDVCIPGKVDLRESKTTKGWNRIGRLPRFTDRQLVHGAAILRLLLLVRHTELEESQQTLSPIVPCCIRLP